MAGRDLVTLADEEPTFAPRSTRSPASRDAYRITAPTVSAAGIARIGALIDDLVNGAA